MPFLASMPPQSQPSSPPSHLFAPNSAPPENFGSHAPPEPGKMKPVKTHVMPIWRSQQSRSPHFPPQSDRKAVPLPEHICDTHHPEINTETPFAKTPCSPRTDPSASGTPPRSWGAAPVQNSVKNAVQIVRLKLMLKLKLMFDRSLPIFQKPPTKTNTRESRYRTSNTHQKIGSG